MSSHRFGVSVCHYGGVSLGVAELEEECTRRGVRILDIRGCAYPEMARAEQVRQARLGGVEVLVFVDAHVTPTFEAVVELVAVAEQHGVCSVHAEDDPRALEFAAVRRDVIEAMVRDEERRYGNSPVDALWGAEKVPAVPLGSPWYRDGRSLVPGRYLTDAQAFLLRAKRAGAVIVQHRPEGVTIGRKPIVARALNVDQPVTDEVGSRFALCIPSFGALDLDQQAAVFALARAGMVVFRLHDCPWIDLARSYLTERALEVGRGVFFLDHDIIFEPNDVLRLCEQALERRSVVAAPYCMRRSGRNIIGSFDVQPGPMSYFEGGGTYPAYYSGLGFAAVPAEVLEDIELPFLHSEALERDLGRPVALRPWYALDCSTGFYAGEDVSFCNRVHDLSVSMRQPDPGFEPEWQMSHSGRPARVFLDSRVRIFHRGAYDYGIEDAGIVVPRIANLRALMTESRRQAAELLLRANDVPLDTQLGMLEFPAA